MNVCYNQIVSTMTVQLDEAYPDDDDDNEMCPLSDVPSVWREP